MRSNGYDAALILYIRSNGYDGALTLEFEQQRRLRSSHADAPSQTSHSRSLLLDLLLVLVSSQVLVSRISLSLSLSLTHTITHSLTHTHKFLVETCETEVYLVR
jgi:hypothetical protein